MLCASRLNLGLPGLKQLVINIHKAPGSSRVGSGANPCAFVPQHYFSTTDTAKCDFEKMKLDWRDVSRAYFASIAPNGLLRPGLYTNATGTYDLGVAMAAATCIHPSHREFGVTSGRPRVVGFFDCVAHAEVMQACPYMRVVMQVQGPAQPGGWQSSARDGEHGMAWHRPRPVRCAVQVQGAYTSREPSPSPSPSQVQGPCMASS